MTRTEAILEARPPFDLGRSLAFLASFPPLAGEHQVLGGRLRKSLRVDGRTLTAEVVAAERPHAVRCTLVATPALPARTAARAFARVRDFLSLDDELGPMYAVARRDRPFAAVVARLHGYHQVKFPSPFEAACWAVLGQRCAMAAARRLKQRLVERYSARFAPELAAPFPEPADFGAADDDEITGALGHAVKGPRIAAVVRAFRDVDPGFLTRGDRDAVEAWLLAIDGVGPWSASFVLIRGIGRMERLPPDAMLEQVFAQHYGGAPGLSEAAAAYGAQQAYWAHYLRAA